jgi:hypothetical protein
LKEVPLHTCAECGLEHEGAAIEVAEPQAEVVVESGPNENDVKIAEVEAAAQVETAKIHAAEGDEEMRAELERLRGEMSGMREILDRLAPPEPEPEATVVVADPPAPEPEPEPVADELPPAEPKPAKPKKQSFSWF